MSEHSAPRGCGAPLGSSGYVKVYCGHMGMLCRLCEPTRVPSGPELAVAHALVWEDCVSEMTTEEFRLFVRRVIARLDSVGYLVVGRTAWDALLVSATMTEAR